MIKVFLIKVIKRCFIEFNATFKLDIVILSNTGIKKLRVPEVQPDHQCYKSSLSMLRMPQM